jgi:cell division protease FtsH
MAQALLKKEVLGPRDLVEILGPRPFGEYVQVGNGGSAGSVEAPGPVPGDGSAAEPGGVGEAEGDGARTESESASTAI